MIRYHQPEGGREGTPSKIVGNVRPASQKTLDINHEGTGPYDKSRGDNSHRVNIFAPKSSRSLWSLRLVPRIQTSVNPATCSSKRFV